MALNPTYYPGELRRDLLDAAIRAVAEHGPAAVSLRSVAKSVGVSHAAPQNHFGDKAGLFAALAVEGFDSLVAFMDDDSQNLDDPLLRLGVGYVRHALQNPSHFAVMWDRGLHRDLPEVIAARQRAFERLFVALRQVDGDLDSIAALARAERAWAAAHGMAVLLLSGSLQPPVGMEVLQYVSDQMRYISVA
jgi:AcrR family transcriptional regulator